jgi:hypothetical protein
MMWQAIRFSTKMSALVLTFLLLALFGRTQAENAPGTIPHDFVIAQAMVPPTGMMDANKPTPMEQRYLRRYPQPARVGDLIGLPVLNLNASTIGYVQQIVRTPQGKIQFIVSYSRLWGWFGRPVAVPLEVLGIRGRELVSLDMPPGDYAKAPTWQGQDVTALSPDATIKVALARA